MDRRPDRHIPYFQVLETVRETEGCPLCDLEHAAQMRYLESVLYEGVNDSGVRAELRASAGYCTRHALLLLEFKDGLGTALLYRERVAEFIESLERMTERGLRRTRKRAARRCPACRVQSQARERYVDVLSRALDDEEMRNALRAGKGLCAPHFTVLLKATKRRKARLFLIGIERLKMHELLIQLDEYSRKHDYRKTGEGFGEEAGAWRRAVQFMAGRWEIFG